MNTILGWIKEWCEKHGITLGHVIVAVAFVSCMALINAKFDALGRDIVALRADIVQQGNKIDIVALDIRYQMNMMEGRLNARISDVEGRIDELKWNDIAHVAAGVSEIAFLLKQRGVLSQDEAEHVRDVVQGK
ncbi:MAG: hypothetical protein LBR38_04800 [Synergistaceae bacterium]|jgi:outer membrane murein-binding lipoprotein Lpp|nr:hypothetical protein [Synergistaceae bacterium]